MRQIFNFLLVIAVTAYSNIVDNIILSTNIYQEQLNIWVN